MHIMVCLLTILFKCRYSSRQWPVFDLRHSHSVCVHVRERIEVHADTYIQFMHLLFKYTMTVAAPDTVGVMDPFSVCVCVSVCVSVFVCACMCV